MKSIVVLTLLSLAVSALGQMHEKEHRHGSHDECSLPKSTSDIIACSIEQHPSIKRDSMNLGIAKGMIEKSAQIPNPTLSARFVDGKDSSELEANLAFTVELGSKRASRKEYAKAYETGVVKSLEQTRGEIKMTTIENLYRLRQILEEKELLTQTISAFKKVIKNLKERPRLSSEQEGSLTLFEIALEEALVEQSELYEEERKVEHYFHISTGHSLEEIRMYLPKFYTSWPSVKVKNDNVLVSANVERLKALGSMAKKDFEIERSKAWPDLEIGPSIAVETEDGASNNLYGVNVSFSLPVFQANGGSVAQKKSEYLKRKKIIDLAQKEEKHERYEQERVYKSSVSILEKTMKRTKIESKQRKIEKLYLRGVISSSVYLDSLNQKLSYLRKRNHRELTAVKALWSIRNFDGTILKESI